MEERPSVFRKDRDSEWVFQRIEPHVALLSDCEQLGEEHIKITRGKGTLSKKIQEKGQHSRVNASLQRKVKKQRTCVNKLLAAA
jgi:hypothetical protein